MKLLLFAALALVVLALVLSIVPGFQFSIVLCFAFAAIFVLLHFLLRFPTPLTRLCCRVIWVMLAVGTLAAAITGGFILKAAHPGTLPDCGTIIVLGAGVRGTVPSLSLSERIGAAYDYLSAHPDTVAVLSGGQGEGEDISEATCMYRELTARGIDGSRLLLEDKSTNTKENLRFSLDVLEEATGTRPQRVGIVSSEYHLFRAGCFAKDLGLDAFGIPARTSWFTLRLNYYLREIAAVWKYLILGP